MVTFPGGKINKMMVRCAPFRELRVLQDEINRVFSESSAHSAGSKGRVRRGWQPKVDIYENQGHIVLEAELPGMKREDFDLSVENNILTLQGERKFEKRDEGDNYHRIERAYGSFTRSFVLPATVQTEDVAAEYKNGVLRVTLPKREEVKARRIEITGSDRPALEA